MWRSGRPVAILQDLPGPKLRIGPLREDIVELKPGDMVTFTCGEERVGDAGHMSIVWPGLAAALNPEEVLYLADGSVRLRVSAVRAEQSEVDAEVEAGGAVASRQGLHLPPSRIHHAALVLRHSRQCRRTGRRAKPFCCFMLNVAGRHPVARDGRSYVPRRWRLAGGCPVTVPACPRSYAA